MNENLLGCLNTSGDRGKKSIDTDSFLHIELPPIIGVVVSFNLLQNLVDRPHLERLVNRSLYPSLFVYLTLMSATKFHTHVLSHLGEGHRNCVSNRKNNSVQSQHRGVESK
jgi:hypothetical protein